MLFVGTSIIHPSTEGVFLLCNILDLLIYSFNIFDRNLVLNSVMSPFAVVLEVKYNGFLLSYIKHMLLPVQKSELSVSKYCMARQIGCDYRF